MLLMNRESLALAPERRIVKASEAAAVIDAAAILSSAEEEAARIVASAREAFEAERRRGYERGLADAGRESCRFIARVEDEMCTLVMDALKECIGEIGEERVVVDIVKKALKALVRNQHEVTVRVAPDKVDAVKKHVGEILREHPALAEVDIEGDLRLSGTACIAETASGMADASAETQLEALEKSIRDSVRQARTGEEAPLQPCR